MSVSFPADWVGPTIHSADPVHVALNAKQDDQIGLVVLADIPGSSVIFLSDAGWENSDFTFGGSEGVFWSLAYAYGIAGELSILWREGIRGM